MKLTLDSLYKDHDNLRRILFLLEQLLIELYRGSSAKYQMVQRVLAYIQEYPERVHHPAEDELFSVMLENLDNSELHDDIIKLMRDHSQIEAVTRNTIKIVESAAISNHQDIKRVGEALLTLIKQQRSHILFEEMKIYPFISSSLSGDHWDQISEIIPETEDPIFGENVRNEYQVLFKAL